MDEQVELKPPSTIRALAFVYANLNEAQKLKGAFSMIDCKSVILAYRTLSEFLKELSTADEEGEKSEKKELMADQEVFSAYRTILAATELQQHTGVFSMEGSVELLENLQLIEAALNKVKDPAISIKEMKGRIKGGSGKKKKKSVGH